VEKEVKSSENAAKKAKVKKGLSKKQKAKFKIKKTRLLDFNKPEQGRLI